MAKEFTHALNEGRRGGWRGFVAGREFEEAGNDSENSGVGGEGGATFGGDVGEVTVKLVENILGELTVHETTRGAGVIVVEYEAERATLADGAEAVLNVGRDNKEIAGVGVVFAVADVLHAVAGKVENELGVRVGVGGDLGEAVAVELQFTQHETKGVNLDFLDEQGAPGQHGESNGETGHSRRAESGFVLGRVGDVLTLATCSG